MLPGVEGQARQRIATVSTRVDGGPLPTANTWEGRPMFFPSGACGRQVRHPACYTKAPKDKDVQGNHTDHRCPVLSSGSQPRPGGVLLLPLQSLAVPTLHQLQASGSPLAINASSVAWAWETGPGKALGPSQPRPLSGWHWAGFLGTSLGVLSGHFPSLGPGAPEAPCQGWSCAYF